MQINTEIKEIIVTIDGTDYPVAEKTIETAERMKKVEEAHVGKAMQHELWLAELEVMLGKDAVRALFPKGRAENLDRMEAIFCGVMSAFDHNGAELREERYRETLDEVEKMAAKLKPITDVMSQYPVKKAK
jgi:hypothetical protein